MSGGAFGGARGYQPRAPEKGVFPLDHFGECKQAKEEYTQCLQRSGGDADACRDAAKRYLQCRMERNLMAQQDLKELGFGEDNAAGAQQQQQQQQQRAGAPPPRKEAAGFVAGLSRLEKKRNQ